MNIKILQIVISMVFSLGFMHCSFADNKSALDQLPYSNTSKQDIRSIANITPSKLLSTNISKFLESDPNASFNFYLGHVDSFATKPKQSIPKYATEVLENMKLPIETKKVELLAITTEPKSGNELDTNLSQRIPVHYEQDRNNNNRIKSKNENADDISKDNAKQYERTEKPEVNLQPLWRLPEKDILKKEAIAAKEILIGFLQQHHTVFELDDLELTNKLPNLKLTDYTVGRFVRKASFEQSIGVEPIIGGKVLVLFDHNWNVVTISRMIINAKKLSIENNSKIISASEAEKLAIQAMAEKSNSAPKLWKLSDSILGIDPIRRKHIWVINGTSDRQILSTRVKINAHTGELLNISDNIDRHSDAKVRRWGYSGGNLEAPSQYVADSFYTRDDNTLVHDFFHIVTDGRGGGDPETTCTSTSVDSLWYEQAYDTTTGSSYVRPTIRSDRNFSLWQPYSTPGSFSESNSYYWARWFFQWIKGSISDLGELPNSSSDYQQVLIVANACINAGGLYKNNGQVTTLNNEGEGDPVIYLPEKCKSGNPNCSINDYTGFGTFKTCEGNGCSSPPSVIHHEINHFLLKQYYSVLSGIDCAIYEELKYLHEGILGSVVPQAYWNHYYNVGYHPADNFLYKADYDAGLIHADINSNRTLSDYPCVDDADPYKSGRVAGQVMWEILHGKHIDGNTISSMPRPATDRDFLVLIYWAAELVNASAFKDRYEMANKVMEIMEFHSNLSTSGKGQWCEAWEHHELDLWINNSYCN